MAPFKLRSSESVSAGHPDKLCDQVKFKKINEKLSSIPFIIPCPTLDI